MNVKSENATPDEFYEAAVADGTRAPKAKGESDEAVVVESNASNYGASAVTTPSVPHEGE